MKIVLAGVFTLLCTTTLSAEVQMTTVEYKAGDATLEGYLAYDDAKTGKLPGIVVIHEWWGNEEYSKRRARELAELGYVAFAADMYGKGKTTNDPKQAQAWAQETSRNPRLISERGRAATDVLKQHPNVDPQKLAAIGYCYGGSVVLEMARAGMDLDGVVCFHGGLGTAHPENTKDVKARILVCNGADDKYVSAAEIEDFKKEMSRAGADFRIINYLGAHHAFTNPDADSHRMDNVKYNAEADRKSWEDMKAFLAEVFAKS